MIVFVITVKLEVVTMYMKELYKRTLCEGLHSSIINTQTIFYKLLGFKECA